MSNQPTEPGFYWAKRESEWEVVLVFETYEDGLELYTTGSDTAEPLENWTWYMSRLTPPKVEPS